MVKKILSLSLAAALTLSAAGCGGSSEIKKGVVSDPEEYYSFSFDRFGDEVMPIGGYIGPTTGFGYKGNYMPSQIDDYHYKLVKDCGVNFIIGRSELDYKLRPDEVKQALESADKNDVMYIVCDSYLFDVRADYFGKKDKYVYVSLDDFKERVKEYSEYPSFAGLYCRDEPFANMFEQIKEISYYLGYVYSKKANLPLLCFIQNGVWDTSGRIPNEDELRWQVNTALAYNTKGLCWYTYWVPDPYHKKMCVHEYGTKTTHYYLAQKINAELLFQDEYLLNFAFAGYMLVGNTPNGETPVQDERIEKFGKIKSFTGGDLFIGCFEYDNDGHKHNAYIIVNNTIKNDLNEKLYFTEKTTFTKIHRDKKEVLTAESIDLKMTPGDAYIIIENLK